MEEVRATKEQCKPKNKKKRKNAKDTECNAERLEEELVDEPEEVMDSEPEEVVVDEPRPEKRKRVSKKEEVAIGDFIIVKFTTERKDRLWIGNTYKFSKL